MNHEYKMALRTSLMFLEPQKVLTSDVIREKVADAIKAVKISYPEADIDSEQLVREVQSLCSIHIDGATFLEDKTFHKEWLSERLNDIEWKFWNRYARYLQEEKGWAPKVIEGSEEMSRLVLSKLEDPNRPGPWDTRGMVVGRVQSGKTANYTGLICKAIDAGYKVIVVLAGMQNSLRSQTQLRIDEGVLGFDTQRSRSFEHNFDPIGVGKLLGEELLTIHPLTNSAENGDFRRGFAAQASPLFGGEPVILVVKKNKGVLENLKQWALSARSTPDPETGRRFIPDIPFLLIDDEADNASIGTKAIPTDANGVPLPDYDVSAINGKIRELLSIFTKSAYVGYTATPFANIFISKTNRTESHGDDIFPRNFIVNLPAPSNYIGPAQIFGVDIEYEGYEKSFPGLPIVKELHDYEEAFPPNHKKDHEIPYLPESLLYAIKSFVLVCAARIARGQEGQHNSMLIHVTRFIQVQDRLSELVKDELKLIQNRLAYGDGNSSHDLKQELKQIWLKDFEATSNKIRSMGDYDLKELTWENVERHLFEAGSKISVKTLNGSAKDALEYYEHREHGLNVIAIGGDKLSRGLTLEGLSISYYLRHSKMYDTLMQMGRWFGYRPGYLDLCRIYTTKDLIAWYEHITLASEELLLEFETMAKTGGTPRDYGLKVRSHPEGLMITARNRMKTGVEIPISYSADLVELVHYEIDDSINSKNFSLASEFIQSLKEPDDKSNIIWNDVPGSKVAEFLDNLSVYEYAVKNRRLAKYIKDQLLKGELQNWTVLLASPKSKDKNVSIGGIEVGLTYRKNGKELKDGIYSINKSHIISPSDEFADLSNDEYSRAMEITLSKWHNGESKGKKEPTIPSGTIIRSDIRKPENGLLILYVLDPSVVNLQVPIIGYAASLPKSPTAVTINYIHNEVALEEDED